MHSFDPTWMIGPFTKSPQPVLRPDPTLTFTCPVLGKEVAWVNSAIFNPAAAVVDGRVCMVIRAESHLGDFNDGCRIGLAWSDDGYDFTVDPEPVLYRDNDAMRDWEWPMGCEDPRLVRRDDGLYVMTYTAFDTRTARLAIATSRDLRHWTKEGLAFGQFENGRYANYWSKSGSIVCRRIGDQLIAERIKGKFWMYFGEGILFAATSDDLIHWDPVEFDARANRCSFVDINQIWSRAEFIPGVQALKPVAFPRSGRFDEDLCEPGPPALLTEQGIVLLYHGSHPPRRGGKGYTLGQILFDGEDPTAVIARATGPFLAPDHPDEKAGVTGDVCFGQGLIPFRDRWMFYYGGADSVLFVADAPLGTK